MDRSDDLAAATAALDRCDAALQELEARCCEPGRSPRMQALAATIAAARNGLGRVGDDPDAPDATFSSLQDAGGQVGRLQVGCCAPNRLPLYAEILEGLTTTQLALNRELGTGH